MCVCGWHLLLVTQSATSGLANVRLPFTAPPGGVVYLILDQQKRGAQCIILVSQIVKLKPKCVSTPFTKTPKQLDHHSSFERLSNHNQNYSVQPVLICVALQTVLLQRKDFE